MNLLDGLILSRSVHQRNFCCGAGYPWPIRLTQNESATSGVSLCGSNRQLLLAGRRPHPIERRIDPRRDQRLLDQRIGRDHVDRLRPLGGRQLADRQPDKLKRGARVLAAAVADDPGNRVGEVELADLVAQPASTVLARPNSLEDRLATEARMKPLRESVGLWKSIDDFQKLLD